VTDLPGRSLQVPSHLLAGALAGLLCSGLLPHPSVVFGIIGVAVGATFAFVLRLTNADSAARDVPAEVALIPVRTTLATLDRFAPWCVLLFFIPVLRLAVAPGADMAMYGGIARALLDRGANLSAAWGTIDVTAYPRGFPMLIALLALPFGMAKATLLSAALAYVVYFAGLAFFLRALRVPAANLIAAICLIVSKSPQSFFGWGGNPTVMAIGLGMLAAGWVVKAGEWKVWKVRGARGSRSGSGAAAAPALLLGAAAACHPVGALAGGLVVATAPILATRNARSGSIVVALIGLFGLFAALAWLSAAGPHLSAAERAWIHDYQLTTEPVVRAPRWWPPIGLLAALPQRLGDPFCAVVLLAAGLAALGRVNRKLLWTTAGLFTVLSILLVVGPELPVVGTLLFPARFTPLLPLLFAPLLGIGLVRAAGNRRHSRLAIGMLCALFAIGGWRHVGWYQTRPALASAADLEVLACLSQLAIEETVIDGAYDDAAQWAPALIGVPVTHPHVHISLDDETRGYLEGLSPTHRFIGERQASVADEESRDLDESERVTQGDGAVCRAGRSVAYRITADRAAVAPAP